MIFAIFITYRLYTYFGLIRKTNSDVMNRKKKDHKAIHKGSLNPNHISSDLRNQEESMTWNNNVKITL